jgi:hypothetical protein
MPFGYYRKLQRYVTEYANKNRLAFDSGLAELGRDKEGNKK